MWAELPPGISNFKSIFRHLIGSLKDVLDPTIGEIDRQTFNPILEGGMLVHDAHLDREVVIQLAITRLIEDTRGLHHVLACKQSPAHVGACPFCDIHGFPAHNKTVYPGAVTNLPMGHRLRRAFQDEFKAYDEIKLLGTERSRAMTTTRAVQHGRACQEELVGEEESPFKEVPPLNEAWALGEDFDVIKVTMADMAHSMNNCITDMYKMIGNHGNMKLTPARWEAERSKGRFTRLRFDNRYTYTCMLVYSCLPSIHVCPHALCTVHDHWSNISVAVS